MASELATSIQRQIAMDRKGHHGKEPLQKRDIKQDRVPYKRVKVAYSSFAELEANYNTTNLVKWLKK